MLVPEFRLWIPQRQGDHTSQQTPDVHIPQVVFPTQMQLAQWAKQQWSCIAACKGSGSPSGGVKANCCSLQYGLSLFGLVGFDVDVISRSGQILTFTI